ncbi:hypothetical protein [Helicobacter pylori]|uniref:hypothetical protein n=1 Tax=Helicobacter pylori TaxID=210 RepID=UPI00230055AE|nr:hypothetical protein [Helicobacter pylori]WCB34248.1 hypothetical protein PHA49_06625 [Helicobacter pylori]WHT45948.1 hypothetical protein QM974_06630 [Helicobacter pylori]
MVKERLEEARNSPKGNFYFFWPLLWGLWLSFFCFFVLSCFIKISSIMYNSHALSIVLKGQRE